MLETVWFVTWALLWAIYFVLDGYDFGVGSLMPFVAKNEEERDGVYRSIAPFWDGNEVWLITAGGVTFAAFPAAYAQLFSALYSPLMLILFALILRGSALALRSEMESAPARRLWDGCFFLGSFLPALLFGVAFANLLQGIPIDSEGRYTGNLLTLLNVQGLLGGVAFLALFLMHGAIWLSLKTEGKVQERAARMAQRLWVPLVLLMILFLAWLMVHNRQLASRELPVFFPWAVLAGALVPLLGTGWFVSRKAWAQAWGTTAVSIVSITMGVILAMYPYMVRSSLNEDFSATIVNSASSPLTLKIMLGVALVFVPLVILYQAWVYWIFRGKARKGEAGY
ncbi:MAG TPA: cytochrome d ubiquinol oxidase subunit II [Candidatus Sumerlaeota bacterium]|nr:cytochrome d ubiquinol oxidase subunit II [Candidatus Sumerlaeota bacterium]